ncbi:MAG: hypothetical protein E6I50_09425 [Chloroflexi bacterium]|nr:MAG: hypothetical protein E6I50_09425 [Chloroflexota bacterium]
MSGARARRRRVAAYLAVELSEPRQGIRRPDAAPARPSRSDAAAAQGAGLGAPRGGAQPRQGGPRRLVPHGLLARLGISVLTLDHGGIRKVLDALRDQEMVITAIDRDITGTGYTMPFLGRPAPIPLGPAAIALRLGTPLFPVCVYRLPDDTFMAEGAPLVYATSTGNARADQVRTTEQVLRHMERFIQQHPEQWHVPHRIWPGSP